MSPAGAVRSVFGNYANFDGRASRSEYWWFYGFQVAVYLGGYIVVGVLAGDRRAPLAFLGLIGILMYSLFALVPTLAVGVRRLHDTDHSGWWLLASVIPLAALIPVILTLLPGSDGVNRYGLPPGLGDLLRTVEYTGPSDLDASREFFAGSVRATAAGYQPVRQEWLPARGEVHVLRVTYGPNLKSPVWQEAGGTPPDWS